MMRSAGLVYRFVAANVRQKKTLRRWWGERRRIDNWLSLYLITSSLAVQTGVRLLIRSKWARGKDLVVRRADGVVLHYPMWRYVRDPASMVDLVDTYASYMSRFAAAFGGSVSFSRGDVVVDLGGHVGTFTIPALAANPGIRVVAVEPDPGNAARLERGLRATGVEPTRWSLEEAAVSRTEGSVAFAVGDAATRGSLAGLGFFREGKHYGTIQVRAMTLAQLFEKHRIRRCKLLKMDCEGCEYGVLKTAPPEILERIDNMILEVHPVEGEDPCSFEPWLNSRGFRVVTDAQSNGCLELFCTRDTSGVRG